MSTLMYKANHKLNTLTAYSVLAQDVNYVRYHTYLMTYNGQRNIKERKEGVFFKWFDTFDQAKVWLQDAQRTKLNRALRTAEREQAKLTHITSLTEEGLNDLP